jgi:hypothetical protein
MTRIADGSVIIQTSSESVPSTPSWFGEVTLMAAYLRKRGVLTKISERVRFARRRDVCYEVIDFLAVLAGLCDQWRTHPGGVLRAAPALCRSVHGLVWAGSVPSALDPLPFFSSVVPGSRRCIASPLSR